MSEVFGWGIARAFPTAPTPGLLRLVQGENSKVVGVATTGWGVQNDGGTAATAVLAVSPADATLSANNITIPPSTLVAFALTGLVSGSKTVSLTTSTPGASVDPANASKSISFTPAPSPPPPAPPPAPAASGARQFALTSGSTVTGARFGAGFTFVKGEIPAGSGVAMTGATTQQVVPKNYYDDGSLRFAVISGTADVVGGTPKIISLAAGTSATGTAPTLADLAATGLTASVDTLTHGSATWTSGDWGSPLEQWESGPVRSTWRYRKPIGSDPHLVAWLEVTLYADGVAEVLPWVENGYIMVAGPDQKADTYSFTLGGVLKYSGALTIKHHQRPVLLSGAALSWWHGAADPGLSIKHDAAYMAATEQVGAYSGVVGPTDALITGLQSTFTPLGDWDSPYQDDAMGGGGSQPAIGPIPRHEVLHFTSTASSTYGAVVRGGYWAGRWGIHYRDEVTHKPLRFSSYPTHALGLNSGISHTGNGAIKTPDAPSGSSAPSWDVAHHPSVGFVPYLITGRKFHLETCQFAATVNYLDTDATARSNGSAIMRVDPPNNDTRYAGWCWRTLAQALAVTPDSDTALQSEFKASLENSIGWYHARHCAQASDPRGHIEGGTNYNPAGSGVAPYMSRQFMEFFCIGALGYARAMNLPLSSTGRTQLADFHSYMGKQVTSLLGGSAEYWWINATTAYNSAVSPSAAPNWAAGTGPWYTNKEAYDAAAAVYSSQFAASTSGALGDNVSTGATSFHGNMHFALAYAVRFDLPGALAGYIRLLGATNYSTLVAGFNADPTWSCKPAANNPPAWMIFPENTWVDIPNSTLAGSPAGLGSTPGDTASLASRLGAFSGITKWGRYVVHGPAGGHQDTADNGMRMFNLMLATWELRKASTHNSTEQLVPYYASGDPAARHAYNNQHWVPQKARIMCLGARYVWGNPGTSFLDASGFNPTTNLYDQATFNPSTGLYTVPSVHAVPLCPIHAFDPASGIGIGCHVQSGAKLVKWVASTDTYTQPINAPEYTSTFAFNPDRQEWFALSWGDGESGGSAINSFKVDREVTVATPITLTGAGVAAFTSAAPANCSLRYSVSRGCFTFWNGPTAQMFKVVPNATTTWTMTVEAAPAGTAPGAPDYNFSRWEIFPDLADMMIFMRGGAHPLKALRRP